MREPNKEVRHSELRRAQQLIHALGLAAVVFAATGCPRDIWGDLPIDGSVGDTDVDSDSDNDTDADTDDDPGQPMLVLDDVSLRMNGKDNALANPGFEEGLSHWSAWDDEEAAARTITSEDVHSGEGAYQFHQGPGSGSLRTFYTTDEGGVDWAFDEHDPYAPDSSIWMEVSPGTTVSLSYWYKGAMDAAFILGLYSSGDWTNLSGDGSPYASDWSTDTKEVTVPDDIVAVGIQFDSYYESEPTDHPGVDVYQDEDAFYEQLDLDTVAVVDFDQYPDGSAVPTGYTPAGNWSGFEIKGDEWSEWGVTFATPSGDPMSTVSITQFPEEETWHNYSSAPNSLTPGQPPYVGYGVEHSPNTGDSLIINFDPPRPAVGLVFIDNSPGESEYVEFRAADETVITTLPSPDTGYLSFLGVVSDIPVATIEIFEEVYDGDDVSYDDIVYGVPR